MTKITPLPVAEWPEIDQNLWAKSRQRAHKLDEPGWAGALRPATISIVERGYGIWLSWLINRGQLTTKKSPADRLSQDRVCEFAQDYLDGRAGNTVGLTLRGLQTAVRAMHQTIDFRWIDRLARHYSAMPKVKNKHARVVPISALYQFGLKLLEQNSQKIPPTPFGAYKFRDGLMISLLAAHPDRLKNIHDLRLGETLCRGTAGYRVSHKGTNMKNHEERSYAVLADLTPWLDLYAEHIRPALVRTPHPKDDAGHLWISQYGQPMAAGSISSRISDLTKAEFDRAISPHLFRDCAATSIAIDDPEHVWITKEVLGHKSPDESQRAYNQACQLSASRRFTKGPTARRKLLKGKLD